MIGKLRCFRTALTLAWITGLGAVLTCDDGGMSGPDVDVDVEPQAQRVGTEGGTVRSGDVSISIPAGALSGEVEITIASSTTPATPEGVVTVGPTVEIGPTGTVFEVPARVTLPYLSGALPSGRDGQDVRIHTADDVGGPFTALTTAVNTGASTASAEVDHLSHFVPAVPEVSSADPDCPEFGDCNCDPVYAERPLDILGTATVGRRVREMCYEAGTDTLTVLSYTLPASDDPFVQPDQYYVTVLDGSSLAVRSETPTEETDLTEGSCTPTEPGHLSGIDSTGTIAWTVRFIEVREEPFGDVDWVHAYVDIGGVPFSFNRHLNEAAPYTDTHSFYADNNGAAARFLADGSVRVYLHIFRERHIDVIQVSNLNAILDNPFDFLDQEGFAEPTDVERIELAPGQHNFGIYPNPIHVSPAADDPNADMVYAFNYIEEGMRLYRVESVAGGGLQIEALDPLPIDEATFWGQFAWQNGGLDRLGVLHVQSSVGSFTNSKLITIEPTTGHLLGDWEIGCVGPPELEGFMALPWDDGRVLRFATDVELDDVHRTMFIRNGRLEAIGEAPFQFDFGDGLRIVIDGTTRRLFVGDPDTGEIAAIAIPE